MVGDQIDKAEAAEGSPPNTPLEVSERLISLDFIRGVAVLGILFANIVAFSNPMLAYSWPGAFAPPMDRADDLAWLGQHVLIDGKMRGLFTLLFGAGMMLFMQRISARGGSYWLQLRRLLWLLLFGLLHFFLLFWGDILFLYAISGLAVLALARWDAKTQMAVGIVGYICGALLFAGSYGSNAMLEQSPQLLIDNQPAYQELTTYWDQRVAGAEEELNTYKQGSYLAEVEFVIAERSRQLTYYPLFALSETIPLMLIGMALFRGGLFSGGYNSGEQRKWGWIGVIASAALSLPLALWAMAEGFPPYLTEFISDGVAQALRLPMILGFAALLALWAPRAARGWVGERMVAAGRMAFSNYIGTSIFMMLVFRSWAGGLYGELGRLELVGVVLLGCLAMLAWSKPWLTYFRYGPLEWLWRCLAYGRLFPFRR